MVNDIVYAQIGDVEKINACIAVSLENMRKTQAKIDELTAELENAQVCV
jgi:hypothetical protein